MSEKTGIKMLQRKLPICSASYNQCIYNNDGSQLPFSTVLVSSTEYLLAYCFGFRAAILLFWFVFTTLISMFLQPLHAAVFSEKVVKGHCTLPSAVKVCN